MLLQDPFVKRRLLSKPEAVEERATHQLEGVLQVLYRDRPLRLWGSRGESQGLLIGLLHYLEVQFEGSLPVEAEQVTLADQMSVRGSRSV